MHGKILTLLTCMLCLWAPHSRATPLLIENVHGYSTTSNGLQRFDRLLIHQGRVLRVGPADAAHPDPQPLDHLDGHGLTLLPGLIDAHGHVLGLGLSQLRTDLVGTHALAEALQRTAEFALAHKDLPWVLGRGWNQVLWTEKAFPTAADLDRIIADRPVWLRRVDGHAGWANHKAMALAGVTAATPDPQGGRLLRDAKGIPTGVFVDGAMALIDKVVPPPSRAQKRGAIQHALAELASLGLTGVHDAGIDREVAGIYRELADDNALPIRVYAMISDTGKAFDVLSAHGPLRDYGNSHLTIASLKLYADGALGSRGAALLAPYSDQPDHSGLLFHSDQYMLDSMLKAFRRGYQVNVHAIGDRGNRQTLDAFDLAFARYPGARKLRNRIEHAQVVALSDIPRFKSEGIVPSMQPTHATSDMNMAQDRIGAERLKGAYAWRSFLNQGSHIPAGSDFPVESANPFFGIHAAVTRQDHRDQPPGGWHAEQAMTVAEALRAFTLDAAWAARQEGELGSLEPGKWADFILIDRDIFKVPGSALWQTRVMETWLAGKRIYAARSNHSGTTH